MRTQQGAYPVQRRASMPANPHYSGHSAGIHPEDQPFISTDLEDDDSYYTTRQPTSARRYVDTRGNQVIQQGNRRIVIHPAQPKKQLHWSAILGLGMLLALALWLGGSYLLAWWSNHQLDSL